MIIPFILSRLARHKRYRQTVRELSASSDRDLKELGIYRADIHEIAREHAKKAA
jgi:uncharacterized protein YjiS (DUF1127 family)